MLGHVAAIVILFSGILGAIQGIPSEHISAYFDCVPTSDFPE
jgi:hypothetical protein